MILLLRHIINLKSLMKHLKSLFFLYYIILSLSGCSGDQCIEADDFGFSKFTISARYDENQLTSVQQGLQVAPWINTNFVINGRPLAIMVRNWEYDVDINTMSNLSAWCPWYGTSEYTNTLTKMCERLHDCEFGPIIDSSSANITNTPCIMRQGVGLYTAIPKTGVDPNSTIQNQRFPKDCLTMHIGRNPPDGSFFDTDRKGELHPAGGVIFQFKDAAEQSQYAESNLYLKILDNYYSDNNGQYRVVIKSGVLDNSNPDPLTYVSDLIEKNLFGNGIYNEGGLVRNIYKGITDNNSYKIAVNSMLSLFISITGIAFLSGNLQISQTTLATIFLKICIVSMLLSSKYSWSFFHDTLYFIFVDGVRWVKDILNVAVESGSGSSNILGLMIAPETFSKLFSLLFVDYRGFIFIILYIVALSYVIMTLLYAAILYLTSIIIIGMIIMMGPVFICFMLFKTTKAFFDNWLKQLISYAFQPIILFAGIALISLFIRDEIYASLGFRICKKGFPNLGDISEIFGNLTSSLGLDFDIGNSIFYWWFPYPDEFTQQMANIPVPNDHFVGGYTKYQNFGDCVGNGCNKYCLAYGCNENRYIELPFLDPTDPGDLDKINAFFSGQYVQFSSLLLLFVCIYLLDKFNSMSVSISKFLAGNSGMTDIHSTSKSAYKPIQKFINKPLDKAKTYVSKNLNRAGDHISTKVSNWYGEKMQRGLVSEALTSSANHTVLDEVKRTYGMDIKDINVNAQQEYIKALQDKIKQNDPTLSPAQMNEKLNELLKKKTFDEIDPNLQDSNLKLLFAQSQEASRFQNAYVNAHQTLAKQGIGYLGRNIKAFRDYKKITNEVKRSDKEQQNTRHLIGEKIVSTAQSVPYNIAKGLVGDELARKFIPREFRGAAWHDMDITDKRLRTYDESLNDQQRAMDNQQLDKSINREVQNRNHDIFRTEFLLNLEQTGQTLTLQQYEELQSKKIAADVYDSLISGKNPALMGEKFINEKATNSQLKEMIDNIDKNRTEFVENDRYILSEVKYEAKYSKSSEEIIAVTNNLKAHYHLDNIDPRDIPALLERYNHEQNIPPLQSSLELKKLDDSMREFEHNRQLLNKLEERKAVIYNEYNKYIEKLNDVRKANNMPEYKKPDTMRPRKHLEINEFINPPVT